MSRPRSSSPSNSPLKFLIVITCVLISSRCHADGHGVLLMLQRFHGWMETHGRSYATTEEKLRRFEIYRSNVEFIEAKNREAGLTFQLGENEFTDLTHEEFLAMYTGGYAAPPDLEPSVITTRAGDVTESGSTAATETVDLSAPPPDSFDWREKGAVTPVKHQGPCNSCWIFAAVATIESVHKIKRKNLISLSEQEIMDCYDSKDGCSRRGSPLEAIKWVMMNGGIASDSKSQYGPYVNKSQTCDDAKRRQYREVKVDSGRVIFSDKKEQDLAVSVTKRPVAVQFDPNDPCFRFYCSGVYTRPGPAKNYTHNLAIVGYGKNTTTGMKYWIAKNSWGKFWGQGGYVHLEKDLPNNPDGLCGLAISPVYPVMF